MQKSLTIGWGTYTKPLTVLHASWAVSGEKTSVSPGSSTMTVARRGLNGYHQWPMLGLVVHYSLMNAFFILVIAAGPALIVILSSCLSIILHSGMTSLRAVFGSEYTNASSLFRTVQSQLWSHDCNSHMTIIWCFPVVRSRLLYYNPFSGYRLV